MGELAATKDGGGIPSLDNPGVVWLTDYSPPILGTTNGTNISIGGDSSPGTRSEHAQSPGTASGTVFNVVVDASENSTTWFLSAAKLKVHRTESRGGSAGPVPARTFLTWELYNVGVGAVGAAANPVRTYNGTWLMAVFDNGTIATPPTRLQYPLVTPPADPFWFVPGRFSSDRGGFTTEQNVHGLAHGYVGDVDGGGRPVLVRYELCVEDCPMPGAERYGAAGGIMEVTQNPFRRWGEAVKMEARPRGLPPVVPIPQFSAAEYLQNAYDLERKQKDAVQLFEARKQGRKEWRERRGKKRRKEWSEAEQAGHAGKKRKKRRRRSTKTRFAWTRKRAGKGNGIYLFANESSVVSSGGTVEEPTTSLDESFAKQLESTGDGPLEEWDEEPPPIMKLPAKRNYEMHFNHDTRTRESKGRHIAHV